MGSKTRDERVSLQEEKHREEAEGEPRVQLPKPMLPTAAPKWLL